MHQILPSANLINANARLYDPVTGRFLAPDPLIQDPASTQNFNRYSYCLNNPLKYTDESGESLVFKISRRGITLGWNFSFIDSPLGIGVGVSYDWVDKNLGAYVEIGSHSEIDLFGFGFDYDYSIKGTYSYALDDKKTSIEIKASATVSILGIKTEGAISAGYSYSSNGGNSIKINESASVFFSAKSKTTFSLEQTYAIDHKKWSHGYSTLLSLTINKTKPYGYDSSVSSDIKYSHSFGKSSSSKVDYDLGFGNTERKESIFESDGFNADAIWTSDAKSARSLIEKILKKLLNLKK